jgi:hypothetical protein
VYGILENILTLGHKKLASFFSHVVGNQNLLHVQILETTFVEKDRIFLPRFYDCHAAVKSACGSIVIKYRAAV